jgi:hypothetical protein
MGGEVGGREAFARRLGHARDPPVDFTRMIGQREGEHDVADEEPAARPQHHAQECHSLPEIRQMMEGVFGHEDISRQPLMRIAEEPAALELQVAEVLALRPMPNWSSSARSSAAFVR